VTVDGRLANGVTAKDLALYLIAAYGAGGGKGFTVEYAGAAIRAMDVEARMTLCNMAAEFSAFTAIIAPDQRTVAYLRGRPYAPAGASFRRRARLSGPPVLRKARLSGLRHARRFPARAGKYFLRKPLTNRDPP